MTTKIRPRTLAVLVAFVGLLGVVAVTIPSSGAAEPSVVRLNLGSDGRYFEYGAARQNLSTQTNSCEIKPPAQNTPDIMALSSAPSQSAPGLGADGIGVKLSRSSGNGSPCTQVETAESLTLTPGATLGGKVFKSVRLDLEMTGNARVILRFTGGATGATADQYVLQTGTSIQQAQKDEWTEAEKLPPYLVSSGPGDEVDACAAPNSSGPNSGGNDNCQWTIVPAKTFSTVTLTTTQGTVSLEGGGDFPSSQDRDSLFFIANSGPTAVGDSRSTNEDTTLNGTSVLANDSDPNGDPMKAVLVGGTSHGSLSLADDGTFTYVPALNYNGPDSFTYKASDGTLESPATTVSITVTPVNDAPTSVNGTASTNEDTAVTVTVAADVDGPSLTASCTSSAGGTVTPNGFGTVSFLPPLNFNGTLVLTCSATDGTSTTATSATITVGVDPVNDPPIAVADSADVNEGESVAIAVLANDTDVDGGPLTVTGIAAVSPSGATAVPNAAGTSVTYTPPPNYTGPGSFTYRARDGSLTSLNAAAVSITVHPVICSQETVSDSDGEVTGSFTRLTDSFVCKRYTLEASTTADTVLFQPSGVAQNIRYRGVVSFGVDDAPPPGASPLRLRYDPLGGTLYQPMLWCHSPQFDAGTILENDAGFPLFAAVTSATLPGPGETWCIASAQVWGDANGDLIAYFQVYGIADPRMSR